MTQARSGEAVAVAAAWGAVAAVALYALLRGGQVALTDEPHPATVVFAGSIGYFWRAATALFGGVLAAFPALLIAQRDTTRAARALGPALAAAALLLVVQAIAAP